MEHLFPPQRGVFMKQIQKKAKLIIDDINGRVAVPILLYLLGVPGIIVLLLWAVFFRGR
jgi:hypothetical protein